ncbi:MAG: hypothetical protein M1834_008470 [Cirrosporium novae-zelandiae]|nr:MAG: hypothetical protein M1834_008470 [Cirrosporium novae-zelandiae]
MSEPPRKILKLKLNTARIKTEPSGSAPPPSASSASSHHPRIRLTNKTTKVAIKQEPNHASPSPSSATPKQKITLKLGGKNNTPSASTKTPTSKATKKSSASTSKKRTKAQFDEDALTVPTAHEQPSAHSSGPKRLKLTAKPHAPAHMRLNIKGKPPVRPVGSGYDSEASDTEIDPYIEEEFIFRMLPGEDCEYIRKAIEERRLGLPVRKGGADVRFKFLDKSGHRIVIRVCDRIYAATMVDLPCIIEGMKSWDKRGWWKTADICQMLLVFRQVKSEDEVKNIPLPNEIDSTTGQWPHGITPPMHNVRKRRFRKRISNRTIEAVEEEVDRLLAEDEKAVEPAKYEYLDLDRLAREESDMPSDSEEPEYGYDNEQDAEGDYEAEYDLEGDLADELLNAFENDDGDAIATTEHKGQSLQSQSSTLPSRPQLHIPLPLPFPTASAIIEQAQSLAVQTPGAESSVQEPTSEDEGSGSDDDEDASGDENDAPDEEALERQQAMQRIRDELSDINRFIQDAQAEFEKQTNPLLKNRVSEKIRGLIRERDLKRQALGEGGDEDGA